MECRPSLQLNPLLTWNILRNDLHFHLQFFPIILTLLLLNGPTFSCSESETRAYTTHPAQDLPHTFVSGRTVEYLPSPIFYDTYIPLIYKIPIPKHTDIALRLNWGEATSCEKPTGGKLCPISYHLFKVIGKLGDDMSFWKPFYVNHTSTLKESVKKRVGFEVICNEISAHFFRTYTNKQQLESYVRALRACSRLSHPVHFLESEGNWVVDKTVYYKMLESFKSMYFANLPTKGSADWAISLNTYSSVHGLLLTNHVMESVRLATALRICQQGFIPETFVGMSMLRQAVHNVASSMKWNYQLVYEDLIHDMEEYYKLPLADCTFSDEYSFIIRILIPIKRRDLSHGLVEISTVPFLEKLPESSGIPLSLCRLRLPSSKLTLIETSKGLLLDTTCEPNKLCKTSEVLTVFENDACTSALLTDDPKIISGNCKFSCFPVDPHALPIIRRINTDTYVAVGTSDLEIHLNCFDKPKQLVPVKLKDLGAVRIKLACNCQILYSNHVSYRPRDPCGKKTIVEHILPYHWHSKSLNNITVEKYEEEPVVLPPTLPPPPITSPPPPLTTSMTTTKLPEAHSTTQAFINPTTIITESTAPVDKNKPDKTPNQAELEDADLGGEIDKSFPPEFTGDVDDEQIEKSIETQEEELEAKFKRLRNDDVHKEFIHGMSNGLIAQLTILWVLVIFLGIVIIYLGYQLQKLMKWRELQAYKDTRIVYRIPPDTPSSDENNKIIRDGSSGGVRVAWDAFYDLFNVN